MNKQKKSKRGRRTARTACSDLCMHPDDKVMMFGGNPYHSLEGTNLPRTSVNFRKYGKLKFGMWCWCSVCGAFGTDHINKVGWMRPNARVHGGEPCETTMPHVVGGKL